MAIPLFRMSGPEFLVLSQAAYNLSASPTAMVASKLN